MMQSLRTIGCNFIPTLSIAITDGALVDLLATNGCPLLWAPALEAFFLALQNWLSTSDVDVPDFP